MKSNNTQHKNKYKNIYSSKQNYKKNNDTDAYHNGYETMVTAFCFALLFSLAQAAIFIICNVFFAPGAGVGGGGEGGSPLFRLYKYVPSQKVFFSRFGLK